MAGGNYFCAWPGGGKTGASSGLNAVQGLAQQATLQVGLRARGKLWRQAQVTRKPKIELVSFSILGFKNPGDENDLVQDNGIALQFVSFSSHELDLHQ